MSSDIVIGVIKLALNLRTLIATFLLLSAATLAFCSSVPAGSEEDDLSGPSGTIINKYLEATKQQSTLQGHAMEVNIDASVPRLNEHGKLRALRKISKVGLITYRVLGFQGDTTVKKEVIARYLQAEQQGQGDLSLAVSPINYKFRSKGKKNENGEDVYVYQVSPRKKRVGLFKGEIWLDATSYLPVLEKGRLVKNPSVFFKKVDFERAFAIQNGVSVPAHMNSTIDTRLVGKVELNISYTNVNEAASDEDLVDQTESSTVNTASLP